MDNSKLRVGGSYKHSSASADLMVAEEVDGLEYDVKTDWLISIGLGLARNDVQ